MCLVKPSPEGEKQKATGQQLLWLLLCLRGLPMGLWDVGLWCCFLASQEGNLQLGLLQVTAE